MSTEDQNLSLQLKALEEAGCSKVFQEKVSSAQADRPGLSEALSHLRPGDTLVVWKLDRLGRSLKELIELINGLRARKVNFKSLNEHIDTSTPTGQLVFHIFCALAEFERDVIRQRTLAGLAAARSRKQVLGRPKGLSQSAKKKAQAAVSLYREGALDIRSICSNLGISAPTFYRYLKHQSIPLRGASVEA